jgi:uncharacterized protein YkwD
MRAPLLVALLLLAPSAFADLVGDINVLRLSGCGAKSATTKLKRTSALDEIAREWSRGGRLREAIARTDTRLVDSASMRFSNADDRTLLAMLKQSYCASLVKATFTDIGVFRRDRDTWIVVAQAFAPPPDAKVAAARALKLVNEARSKPRRCGNTRYPAVPALSYSTTLERAALVQAKDMATRNFFEHEGSDGSTPAQRVSRVGYAWSSTGENIALGWMDTDGVVAGWLDSPGHCTNIMSAKFTQMGLAFAVNPQSEGGIYWSQVFGTPRNQ